MTRECLQEVIFLTKQSNKVYVICFFQFKSVCSMDG